MTYQQTDWCTKVSHIGKTFFPSTVVNRSKSGFLRTAKHFEEALQEQGVPARFKKVASGSSREKWELDFNLFTIQGTLVYGAKVENTYHINIRTNF